MNSKGYGGSFEGPVKATPDLGGNQGDTAYRTTIREKTFLLYIFFGKWDPYISTTEIYIEEP